MDGLIAYALAKKAISTSMGDIGTNLTYRGSVSSVDDLPSGAQAGDMYGVGTEGLYAWNGSAWGAIGRQGPQGHGDDGFSPTVTVTDITGGHRVTITDAEGDHSFDVMNGQGGGTSDYSDLLNKPKINSHELAGNQSASDLGLAPSSHNHTKTDITDFPTIPTALSQLTDDSAHRTVTDAEKSTWDAKGTYSKPSGGIPDSDLASTFLKSSDITGKEDSTNKVTSISSSSTDTQYPSAKCMYTLVGDIESALAALR